jgi:hypothetical protein
MHRAHSPAYGRTDLRLGRPLEMDGNILTWTVPSFRGNHTLAQPLEATPFTILCILLGEAGMSIYGPEVKDWTSAVAQIPHG